MSTSNTTPNTTARTTQAPGRFRLPDPPEREPDEKMTSAKHLHEPGNTHHLAQHFGNPGSNLVSAERYITMMPERGLPSGLFRRYPDLLIALGVDPAAYEASNGYIIGEQGKPPDFVLEVASRSTGAKDTGPKREDYAALGSSGILAVRRDGRVSRGEAGRGPAGGRCVRCHRDRGTGGRELAGIQRRAGPVLALGTGAAGLARPGHGKAHSHL